MVSIFSPQRANGLVEHPNLPFCAVQGWQRITYVQSYVNPRALADFVLNVAPSNAATLETRFQHDLGDVVLFLKCVSKDDDFILRGFLFLESNSTNNTDTHVPVLSNPDILKIKVGLHSSSGVSYANLDYWECPHSDPCRSTEYRYPWFSFRINNMRDAFIFIEGSRQTISLSDVSVASYMHSKQTVRHILSSTYGKASEPTVFSQIMGEYISYHHGLGLSGTTHYCRPSMCKQLLEDPDISSLIHAGTLKLEMWDAVPARPDWVYYDQALQYNHAILKHYGTGTYLYIADLDEYLALDGNLWKRKNCLLEHMKHNSCSQVAAYIVYADANNTLGNIIPSLTIWENTPSSYKSIVNPDNTYGFYVHEGRVCVKQGDAGCEISNSCIGVPSSCGRIAHHFNMFRPRASQSTTNVHKNESWYRHTRTRRVLETI